MYQNVLEFWFDEIEPESWFKKDTNFDNEIISRFGKLHRQAVQGELSAWRHSSKGALAEIILLDQFSRNIYRDHPDAFAADPMALALAQVAIANGFDVELSPTERSFLYMPFMHSESAVIHEEAVKLFRDLGIANNLDFEFKHKEIVDRFGRYPHRNATLGRKSSSDELAFLDEPNSSF
ncbi:DUF924 domain-containing protein [Marinomonas rhizomae]|uniref:Uncharacterized protein (DUF924 family) n=1 Tax=Marinomonas rhizomae TaxID=491948 RepID=A0A366IZP8_9GAMM|nr:DUF924 family protein [Marinomonas rhizomae]RBP79610.1 uncharacterized protein (DUF924 family) [Marinomonas rhizomae]RNF71607.1 DUF924 domain-containing protein [Marinomonas rhizomae]